MRRREFITLLGGAVAGWPLTARAQQGERMRRIGLLSVQDDNADMQARFAAFRRELERLGWIEARNLRIDIRFGAGESARFNALAAELVNLAPDVIVTSGAAPTRAVQLQTKTIPIVITGVGDPIANGIVKSLARPEGNTTGVTNLFAAMGGKWMELLKEAVPSVERVGLIYNAGVTPDETGYSFFPPIDEAGTALGVRVIRIGYRDAVDLVHEIEEFARQPNGGLIIVPPAPTAANRQVIVRLATQHRLPTTFQNKQYVVDGGLLAYGSDAVELNRRAAVFVDRIFRGAKVSELPVEYPTKFELVVNLRCARAIGIEVPPSLLTRADEVIE
jgi:putative ABC transport system substrate-binding protein